MRSRAVRSGGKAAVAAAAGLAITSAVVLLPSLRFAYEGADAHLALEVAQGVIGLAVAYLVWGRLQGDARLGDAVLLAGLSLSTAANLLLGVVPELLPLSAPGDVQQWAPTLLRAAGALSMACAPFLYGRHVPDPRRTGRVVLGAVALYGLLVVLSLWAADGLPPPVEPGLTPGDSRQPLFAGHPVALVLQALVMAGYTVSAVGYVRLGRTAGDEFVEWVAAGVTLGAFARLNYLLFPSLFTDWLYTGDLLRLGFWLLLLVGTAREVRRYWERLAEAAVAEERHRIARDLHDGLAQELAFMVGQSGLLRDSYESDLQQLYRAAERALAESRRAIAVLSGRGDESLASALLRAAEDAGQRHGTHASVRGEFAVDAREREELVRIVREAVNNAARHGRAGTVHVELAEADGGRRLVVRDDGLGFDTEAAAGKGGRFGLASMRERAEALGASFALRSTPGEGTEVEVVLP